MYSLENIKVRSLTVGMGLEVSQALVLKLKKRKRPTCREGIANEGTSVMLFSVSLSCGGGGVGSLWLSQVWQARCSWLVYPVIWCASTPKYL